MITLDWTILACGVVFLFTLWALSKLLFRPILQVMGEREELTARTQEEAASKTQYQEALYQEYADKVKEEKQRGYQHAETVRREAVGLRQQRISEAKTKAEAVLFEARQQVEKEVASVKDSLQGDAEEMADIITSRILDKG